MCHSATGAADDFNDRVIDEFRANHGRVTGSLTGTLILLLHHVGARSGIERVTPLVYTPHRAGGFLIIASNGGSLSRPSWYFNLKAHPRVQVELNSERFTARAEELEGTARAKVWPKLLADSPSLRQFDASTTRRIPLLLLTPAR